MKKRLVFETPVSIDDLRRLYNHKVTMISSTKDYPMVKEIEFSGDYHSILKKRMVPVRITKKIDKEIERYKKELEDTWRKYQKRIQNIASIKSKSQVSRLLSLNKFNVPEEIDEFYKKVSIEDVKGETDNKEKADLRRKFLKENKKKLLDKTLRS